MSGRGRFITLEGGEGTGKSTQARRLAQALRRRGLSVVETREPGGSPGAELLRAVLLEAPAECWDAMSEALILSAARRDHLATTIRPALARGDWVVCDRFADSTLAYQGFGHGVDPATLEQLYDLAVGPFGPDLTLVLDLDPQVGLERAKARGAETRFEHLDIGYHHRVHMGFIDIVAREPERCAMISAAGDEETVEGRILAAVEARMAEWSADADAVEGADGPVAD
ncbi:dTMP kinase [Roseospira goensis]|uniref:Thymidylate kinase n=1 Tax=Roseospira goensis TaxID=391922 RepID=A0A7W6RX08_9PROT|nr:dTMP kinase [Roseospira goensis]